MNWREGFKAMDAKVIVFRIVILFLNWSLYLTTIGKKRFEFFWALAKEKTKIRHDLTSLLSQILCNLLPFVDELFFSLFPWAFCISFSLCSSLDISLFTYAFSCSLFAFLSPYSAYFSVLFNFLAKKKKLHTEVVARLIREKHPEVFLTQQQVN